MRTMAESDICLKNAMFEIFFFFPGDDLILVAAIAAPRINARSV